MKEIVGIFENRPILVVRDIEKKRDMYVAIEGGRGTEHMFLALTSEICMSTYLFKNKLYALDSDACLKAIDLYIEDNKVCTLQNPLSLGRSLEHIKELKEAIHLRSDKYPILISDSTAIIFNSKHA